MLLQLVYLLELARHCEGTRIRQRFLNSCTSSSRRYISSSSPRASFVPPLQVHLPSNCNKKSDRRLSTYACTGKKYCTVLSSSSSSTSIKTDANADSVSGSECWSPRSQHWENDELFQQEAFLDINININMDLDLKKQNDGNKKDNDNDSSHPSPMVTIIHRNKAGKAIAVEVASAISDHHVANVRALSHGISDIIGGGSSSSSSSSSSSHDPKLQEHFEHRSFGDGKGGNDCTYLAPFLQALCPNVASRVIDVACLAWRAASWNDPDQQGDDQDSPHHPDPTSLGIRTSEHLSYNGWRSLEAHKDVGSMYTIMISIKDPNEYEGGEFFLHNSMLESTEVKLDRLSAIVFLSNTIHGVRPITSGHRESFVTELWRNDDSPVGICRPTEEEWEAFLL